MSRTVDEVVKVHGGLPSDWRQHSNGGGWIYTRDKNARRTQKIDPRVFIGPDAVVMGRVKLSGKIRIEHRARVYDGPVISGNAYIGGDARVYGAVKINGPVQIYGSSAVSGNCKLTGHVVLSDSAVVMGARMGGGIVLEGDVAISGQAVVTGKTTMKGYIAVTGRAVVTGGTWHSSPLYITGPVHGITNSKPGYLKIGCTEGTFDWWLSDGTRLAEREGYSAKDVAFYREAVEFAIKVGRKAGSKP